MHTSSGRWLLGLALALTTAILWGLLPVVMKEVLKGMDAYTVTWYRFTVAGVCLFSYLYLKGKLPRFKNFGYKGYLLLLLAMLGLLGNYVTYMMGLNLLTPGTTQLMMQIGQIMLIVSSVIIFKESFNHVQVMAVIILLVGFLLFFNQRLIELLTSLGSYTIGIIILVISSMLWTGYALCQKQLLVHWNSMQILMMIYLGSSLFLFPTSHPSQITQLTSLQFWLLVFSCANTIIAYGAFAEALAHWEASKVTATLAIAPLVTFIGATVGAFFWPAYFIADSLNILAYLGAIIVVMGSALVALSPIVMQKIKARRKQTNYSQLS
ncbi:DMT family transporter [Entomomonas sp. E2T0]|uniref:DMT family transporter n=1 Tax=Entomomonas sp. E2T0 TaxID=2930213 RepID=UPI002228102C|nr:DMT family transporter [Entomomonas sp. E2T0]UYZ82967.1 DMT family transporter [Entomomonas sp. E2T0]